MLSGGSSSIGEDSYRRRQVVNPDGAQVQEVLLVAWCELSFVNFYFSGFPVKTMGNISPFSRGSELDQDGVLGKIILLSSETLSSSGQVFAIMGTYEKEYAWNSLKV
jgi:hypothetical protein